MKILKLDHAAQSYLDRVEPIKNQGNQRPVWVPCILLSVGYFTERGIQMGSGTQTATSELAIWLVILIDNLIKNDHFISCIVSLTIKALKWV
uniref:Uncharacterized protein n=1 Tax=Nelumbo nucifera TaxID=4432 RepID=A0A822XZN2_NELNU|nr:TPA_asm: hypothetical protein HUJ06_028582 [Nelumbo nucifera]